MPACLCVFVFIIASAHTHSILVNTTEGVVEGYKAKNGDYYEFYGIPYAGPTDGARRFKSPVPPMPHQGVFRANDSNIVCAQPDTLGPVGIENCLTLNIFTNNVTTRHPVIVWLYAEEYTTTVPRNKFSFQTFVNQNLVFVSINFRVSIFGFLCLGIEEAPGNAGLKDVLQGLKWINSNIANFGGDPENIVLMGHASGAAIVDLITMAPQAKGLVHKAIALSGSSVAPWAVAYDPVGYAELLGAHLGYSGKSKEDLGKFLTTANFTDLNTALLYVSGFRNNTPLFAPCIEDITLNPNDTVLSESPLNLIRLGKFLHIPYITGYTTREGTMRIANAVFGDWLDGMDNNFGDFLPVDMVVEGEEGANAATKIKSYYFKNEAVDMNNIDGYLNYEGDSLVVMPVIKEAIERSTASNAEVRLLIFGYIGTYNSDWLYNVPLNGVKHGGLLNYLFDFDLRPIDDKFMMKTIVNHFAVFAKTGKQNVTEVYGEWLPITSQRFNTLKYYPYGLGNFTIFADETDADLGQTMLLWDSVYSSLYKSPNPVNYLPQRPSAAGDSTNSIGIIFSSFVFIMFNNLYRKNVY